MVSLVLSLPTQTFSSLVPPSVTIFSIRQCIQLGVVGSDTDNLFLDPPRQRQHKCHSLTSLTSLTIGCDWTLKGDNSIRQRLIQASPHRPKRRRERQTATKVVAASRWADAGKVHWTDNKQSQPVTCTCLRESQLLAESGYRDKNS